MKRVHVEQPGTRAVLEGGVLQLICIDLARTEVSAL